jgi:hypothetical protein
LGFKLRIEDGSYVQTLEVRTGALTVGKNPPNGLALTSPGLSARHAVFRQSGERVEIEALPTKVGVRLRGERVDHALLAVDETIQVGWAKITVVEVTPDAAVAAAATAGAAEMSAGAAYAAAPATTPLELEDLPTPAQLPSSPTTTPASPRVQWAPPMPGAVFEPSPPGAPAASALSAHPAHPAHAAEPAADFVVLSRKAVRVLPWWGISIAIHAILFAIVLALPKPEKSGDGGDDATFAVTIRNAPQHFDAADVPVVEMSRRGVDVQRPDMAVPVDTPDSTLPVSQNPKGRNGSSTQRNDDPGAVLDDAGGGNPWAQPNGSSSIGVGVGGRTGTGVATNLDDAFGKDDADKANAAAAGKLNGDPFTRSLVSGLRLRTNEKNVKVVPGDYDHGELVMTALGLTTGRLTANDIGLAVPDQEVRAIFYNCGGREASATTLKNLERWVSEGGWLFTSDWQVEYIVERAFPGYIKVLRTNTREQMTPNDTITFTIAPGNHPLLAGLPPEEEKARWWLEDSSILFTVVKPEAVEVLAQSADLDHKYGTKYVAVTFKYGKGRVVHALGHMYQKEGNLRGAYAMQRLLINFLYQAIKAQ